MKKYRDNYFKKAKQENYPARSVYKLKDMDKRFQIFKKGQKILDLGAVPGSWTLFASERVGSRGSVMAVDKKDLDIDLPKHVYFVQSDLFDPSEEFSSYLDFFGQFDVVLSDMAPETTGIKERDQTKSIEMAEKGRELGAKYLQIGGTMLLKVFSGPDLEEFHSRLKQDFKRLKTYKPAGSRSESMECFLLGFGMNEIQL